MDEVLYFYDQPCSRIGNGRRKRKAVDDDSYGFSSSVSTYFQEDDVRSRDLDSTGHHSLLPDAKTAVSSLKQRLLDGLFGHDEDLQRLIFEEARLTAPDLLARLEMYLNRFVDVKPSIPTSLRNDLSSGWTELIANVRYDVREWQCLKIQDTQETETSARRHTHREPEAGIELNAKAVNKTSYVAGDVKSHACLGKDLTNVGSGHKSFTGSHLSNFTDTVEMGEKKELRSPVLKVSMKPKSHTQHSVFSNRSESAEPSQRVGPRPFIRHPGSASESKLASHQAGYYTQIQFQLSSKACKDKGWIAGSDRTDSEVSVEMTLRRLTERLREAIKENREQPDQEKELDYSASLFHFYGDNLRESVSKSKRSGSVTAQGLKILKGLRPRIPPLTMAIGAGKSIFKVSMLDGSCIVYYPSGRVAVSFTRPGQSALPGFYTVVYDDELSQAMLASFTPSGKGCCYHGDGSLWFLATESGYLLAERESPAIEEFDWPTSGVKLSDPVTLQLNQKLTFHCSGLQSMHISFSWQRQAVRFYVGLSSGAEKSPTKDELGCLLAGLDFISKTAHNFSESQYQRFIKQKHKLKMTSHKDTVSEIGASMLPSENTGASKENENCCMKLKKKIKTVLEEWLMHYRSSLGILPPEVALPEEPLSSCDVQSSGSRSIESEVITEGNDSILLRTLHSVRLLSAPAGDSHQPTKQQQNLNRSYQSFKFYKNSLEKMEGVSRRFGVASFQTPSSDFDSSMHFAEMRTGFRSFITQPVNFEAIDPALGLCPAKLHLAMLGELDTDKHCPHRTIPFITDLEYDEFIEKFIPENQLAVIAVISSVNPQPTSYCRSMLEHIHERRFHTRLWPCIQSHNDGFRIFLYDVATAGEHSGNVKPLLMRRHNVDAGMFLMYKNGKLRFCNHIFNGYSTKEKDFLKQLHSTNVLADKGHFLPCNFRFSPHVKTGGIRPVLEMDTAVEAQVTQYVVTAPVERRINLASSKGHQNRAALNQVFSLIGLTDSVAFQGSCTNKAKSEKSNSVASSSIVASQST